MEAKEDETLFSEYGKSNVREALLQPDADEVTIKEEQVASQKVKDTGSGTKRLLTMAGLFDCWKAPKVIF